MSSFTNILKRPFEMVVGASSSKDKSEPLDKITAEAIENFPCAKNARDFAYAKAAVYRLEVGPCDPETKEYKKHTIICIPRNISRVDLMDSSHNYTEMNNYLANARKGELEWTYNICMFDVSGSVREFWSPFVRYWNQHMRHKLDGSVDVYTFDSSVRYIHNNPELHTGYFSGYATRLSTGLTKIAHLIRGCPHKHVRVFLTTDGRDVDKDPLNALQSYSSPHRKRVDVYVLGLGHKFPVDVSLNIRSILHTGSPAIPTLFWAKTPRDIDSQLDNMRGSVTSSMSIRLNKPALVLPTMTETKDVAYGGDILYYEEEPEVIVKTLVMVCDDEPKVKYDKDWKRNVDRHRYNGDYRDHYEGGGHFGMMMMMDRRHRRRYMNYDDDEMYFDDMDDFMMGRHGFRGRSEYQPSGPPPVGDRAILKYSFSVYNMRPRMLLDDIYKQWASIILQRTKTKKKVESSVYDFMEEVFSHYAEKQAAESVLYKDQSIKARLERKSKTTLMTEFKEFLKECREASDVKAKFANEVKLANSVLKTTVSTKYDDKALKVKGYGGSAEWNADMGKFMEEYEKIKEQILALPNPSPEESCRVYLTSFLADLQDSANFETLVRGGKLNFLQEVTFCGVPVLSPVKDSTQMNPWTIQIRNVINSPYEIMCQRILEDSMPRIHYYKDAKDKSIYIKGHDKRFKFNIIIPVVPREYTELLKPLLTSTVYAVACSYCILKNANILDRNCHLAALGCIWMRCVREFPLSKRPEYIRNRILNIEANAKVYLPRKTIATYIECLLTLPYRALQTESETPFKDVKIKCESILKPCFLLHLIRDDIPLLKKHRANFPKLLQYVLSEFLGRCVTSYKSSTPFIDFFLPVVDSKEREGWITAKSDKLFRDLEVSGTELLKKYPDLNGLQKLIKTSVKSNLKKIEEELSWQDLIGDDPQCRQEMEVTTTGARRQIYRYPSDDGIYGSDLSFNSDSDDELDEDAPRAYDNEEPEPEWERGEDYYDAPKLKILMPNFDKINKLRHSGSAGQIDWGDLKAWAQEMLANLGVQEPSPNDPPGAVGGGPSTPNVPPGGGDPSQTQLAENATPPEERPVCLIQEDVDLAFSLDNVTLYLYHALTHRSSTDRLLTPMVSPQEAKMKVEEIISTEWKTVLNTELVPKVEKMVKDAWLHAYKEAHSNLAKPLTRAQIISLASARGIEVNEENFNKVYKHRKQTGLCRNACQVQQCPHFLVPNRHMNAHLEVERQDSSYPHTLHMVVSRNIADEEGSTNVILESRWGGTQRRKKKYVSGGSGPIKNYVRELKDTYKEYNESNN